MAKLPKRPRDANQLAKFIVDLAVGETSEPDPNLGKDARAVARGKRGGIIGGTMLGLGRALGETIAVVMIISPRFKISLHMLEAGTNSVSSLIAIRYSRSEAVGRPIGELIVPDHLRVAPDAGFARYRAEHQPLFANPAALSCITSFCSSAVNAFSSRR